MRKIRFSAPKRSTVPGKQIWLVRVFALGITIPLGLISVYLHLVRPGTSYFIQFMFYGFFLTMIVAVKAMGITMLLKHDLTFLMRDLVIFLGAIVFAGFFYILAL